MALTYGEITSDISGYLHGVITFLSDLSWVYRDKNIDLLRKKVFDKCPDSWVRDITMNKIDGALLQDFIRKSYQFSINRTFTSVALNLNSLSEHFGDNSEVDRTSIPIRTGRVKSGNSKVKMKKVYEIECLAPQIDFLCKKSRCGRIIDLGAGMAHLSESLLNDFGYQVLPIEADVSHQRDEINYLTLKLVDSPECFKTFLTYLEDMCLDLDCSCSVCSLTSGNKKEVLNERCQKRFCLIGLHCCGDLTITMIKLFNEIPHLHSLFLISCCYHKTTPNTFPTSGALSSVVKSGDGVLAVPALRLAAQQTIAHIHQRTRKAQRLFDNNLIYRAVLELFLTTHKLELKKKHQALVHVTINMDAKTYISEVINRVNFISQETNLHTKMTSDEISKEYITIYENSANNFDTIKSIVFLQNHLQSVLETLVMVDRSLYLDELFNNNKKSTQKRNTFCIPAFSDASSPRNLALISLK